jgi:hypothetical protein
MLTMVCSSMVAQCRLLVTVCGATLDDQTLLQACHLAYALVGCTVLFILVLLLLHHAGCSMIGLQSSGR